jgi:hypothetical protein
MKENVLYWIRVVILTLVLLFILISCTAWAAALPGSQAKHSFDVIVHAVQTASLLTDRLDHRRSAI